MAAFLRSTAIPVVAVPVVRLRWCRVVVRPVRNRWVLFHLMAGVSGVIPPRAAATAFRLNGLLRLWAAGGAMARPMLGAVALALAVVSMCRFRCVGALLRQVLFLLVAKASLADQ